ncbi:MAG: hypothetical protein QOF42_1421 [Gammaproteobacteria bacterium]|jgi:hypothetical protein|nr:hypothetical protein [Gammaproteobacteria bacterium]
MKMTKTVFPMTSPHSPYRVRGQPFCIAGVAAALSFACCNVLYAGVEIVEPRDTLDTAIAGPALLGGSDANAFNVSLADHQYYDTNVFRLPTNVDVKTAVGPNASRSDWINSPQAAVEGQWGIGRQVFDVAVNVQDNRYFDNSALNNVSTNDHLLWNWGIGGVLTGQVGASYLRDLVSFVNATDFARTIYGQQQYFGAIRYQVGPHWTVYGGILDTIASVDTANSNNSRSTAVDLGAELATDALSTFGVDYRYTDARYPNGIVVNTVAFDPDYREDRARFLVKRPLTEKTTLDLSVGYLRRDYVNSLIGSFNGPIWRITAGWQPTDKTQLLLTTWRNLQAYLTDQSNYFRSTGVSLSPLWNPTERIAVALTLSRETQTFIGSSSILAVQASRHDTVNGAVASVSYAVTRALSLDAAFHHEQRGANSDVSSYADNLISAGAKFVF